MPNLFALSSENQCDVIYECEVDTYII
jgi:hypothetical protein